jgi:hypothetical protein
VGLATEGGLSVARISWDLRISESVPRRLKRQFEEDPPQRLFWARDD